jgi:SMC interacting uncharacterized protein involved in chromosome segregation
MQINTLETSLENQRTYYDKEVTKYNNELNHRERLMNLLKAENDSLKNKLKKQEVNGISSEY